MVLFNSLAFGVFLITVILAIRLFKNNKLQLSILILASYYFYFVDSGYLFVLLLFSTLLDFYVGRKIFESTSMGKRKFFLLLSIIGNLGILAFFKYADFAIQIANQANNILGIQVSLPLLNIVLPIGISFFTFQTMSYTIDIYMKKLQPTNSFLKFMLFVAFFPQLVAGPIIRASVFLPQLNDKIIRIIPDNVKIGLTLISWGLVKKVVFADGLAPLVNSIFSDPVGLNSFTIMIGALAFGIQIYCDFSGYTDIAIGAARILGFKFPKNFDKPYFSKSVSEFWNRWHISLSSWFRDYVYTPFVGKKFSMNRIYLGLFITFLISGLWHGASLNFVIWGGLHGFYLLFSTLTHNIRTKIAKIIGLKGKFHTVLKVLITQYFIFLGWIFFRVRDLDHLLYSVKKYVLFDFNLGLAEMSGFIFSNLWAFILIVVFIYLHFLSYRIGDTVEKISALRYRYWLPYLLLAILVLLLFAATQGAAFIYFKF